MFPNSFPNVIHCLLMVTMVMVAHTKVCIDTGKMCWWWSLMKWCSPKNSYSKNECPKRCNLCHTDPVLVTSSSMVTQSTPVIPVIPSITASISVTPQFSTSMVIASSCTSPTQVKASSSTVQDCKFPTLPFSHNVLENMYMIGHVFSKHIVVSEAHCEDLCLRAHLCLGYNFNQDQNAGSNNCELLDHVDNFSPKSGSVFRLFDRDAAIRELLGNDEAASVRAA
ncbi:uncharacterized protein LOC116307301 [Actinia tenebrosa]|uniref:Uncharacterized protein LOC116307301 n=1 Tax=Actinia tenebrosa TaxID=6105 RepID=A0A6P8J626_ACTTE|nr:uncharacterized protein LOC116307301 [Actinia tenebrosa]XP_031573343.1 uncharacterized protein LOC116307301 [Actinia tenebrosa]XP_031573344.1 uncharacterized protein LOC116307301 [Actinia tenebrosa]